MIAQTLDGRAAADRILHQLKQKVVARKKPITLATILVGARYDSALYVKLKRKAAASIGVHTEAHHLPSTTTTASLHKLIRTLNRRANITGILLQLPLPKHLDADAAVAVIDPKKDVDGFQIENTRVTPPPIGAVLRLIALGKPQKKSLAVIIAQQSIFTQRLATAVEQSGYMAAIVEPHHQMHTLTRQADIIVTVLGAGPRITASMIKKNAVIVDVGIRQLNKKTVGDVEPSAWKKAKAISPVPGGVGPLTIACVLENTYQLAIQR